MIGITRADRKVSVFVRNAPLFGAALGWWCLLSVGGSGRVPARSGPVGPGSSRAGSVSVLWRARQGWNSGGLVAGGLSCLRASPWENGTRHALDPGCWLFAAQESASSLGGLLMHQDSPQGAFKWILGDTRDVSFMFFLKKCLGNAQLFTCESSHQLWKTLPSLQGEFSLHWMLGENLFLFLSAACTCSFLIAFSPFLTVVKASHLESFSPPVHGPCAVLGNWTCLWLLIP